MRVMPGQSGRELAAQLTARWPQLKVLFMSGYADDEMMRRGLADLDGAFLQKPFTSAELAQAVRSLIDDRAEAESRLTGGQRRGESLVTRRQHREAQLQPLAAATGREDCS